MSEKMRLTGETLAQFEALNDVRTVRRAFASHEDLTADGAGLLAAHTPLRESAGQIGQVIIGPEKISSVVKSTTRKEQTLLQRAKHWKRDPARIWLVGLIGVIAVGLLTILILMLTDSL